MKYTGGYIKGKRDGKGKLFHTNGNLRYNGYFKDGKIYDDNAVLLYQNGNVEFCGVIKLGKKEGLSYKANGVLKNNQILNEVKIVNTLKSSKQIPTPIKLNPNENFAMTLAKKQVTNLLKRRNKSPLCHFNIDLAYIEKAVFNKYNEYYINIFNKNDVDNFISNHKKNEYVRVFDKETKKLRFQGIVFFSKKQGSCCFYDSNENLFKKEIFINNKK